MFWSMIPLAVLVLGGELLSALRTWASSSARTSTCRPSSCPRSRSAACCTASPAPARWVGASAVGRRPHRRGRGVALAWFIRRQLHLSTSRCLQLRALKTRDVRLLGRHRDGGQLGAGSVGSVILPIYLQNVLGLTAFETGILMTPGAVCHHLPEPDQRHAVRQVRPARHRHRGPHRADRLAGRAVLRRHDNDDRWRTSCAFYVIQSCGLTLANMPVTTWGHQRACRNDHDRARQRHQQHGPPGGWRRVRTALIVTVMTMVTAANAEAWPGGMATAAGIDVAYGISAAVAGIALDASPC